MTEKTMFEQVVFTNLTFGKPALDRNDPQYWQKLAAQVKLIKEEFEELEKAIKDKNFKEIRDAVADINVTNLGLAHLASINAEDDMRKVFDSNLSKVSKTMQDAEVTQKYYLEEKGVPTYIEQCPTMPGFIVKVSETVIGKDNKEYVKGKFLKCRVSFFDPKFEDTEVAKNSVKLK